LFTAKFTAENWQKWQNAFNQTDVNLSLPKLRIDYSEDLSAGLAHIGMPEAFDLDKADFANLIGSPYKCWISRVLQKTYINIDEKGTEAAAATAVIMGETAACINNQKKAVDFKADHPFVFLLIDKTTNEILFLGSITNPNS
jgi:serpin B